MSILILFIKKLTDLWMPQLYIDFSLERQSLENRLLGLENFYELVSSVGEPMRKLDSAQTAAFFHYNGLLDFLSESSRGRYQCRLVGPDAAENAAECCKFAVRYIQDNLPLHEFEVACQLVQFKLMSVFENLSTLRVEASRLRVLSRGSVFARLKSMQLLRCMELRFQELYEVDEQKYLRSSASNSQLCALLSDSAGKQPSEHTKVKLAEVLERKNWYLEMVACIERDIDRKDELFQYLRQNNKIESNTLFKYNQVIHSSNTKIITLYSQLRGDSRKALHLKNLLKAVLNRLDFCENCQEADLDLPETLLTQAVVFTSTIQQNENAGLITDISPNFEVHLGRPSKPSAQLNLNDWFPGPLRDIHKKMMIKESANYPKVFNKQIKFFIETYDRSAWSGSRRILRGSCWSPTRV